jgi:hypothetical protein
MAARKTQPVRFLMDYTATPPRPYEAATWSDHALGLFMGAEWDRPHHGEGSMTSGRWGVIRRGAPADARPVWVTYERAEARPWAVEDPDSGAVIERFRQMWQAFEAAAGELVTP